MGQLRAGRHPRCREDSFAVKLFRFRCLKLLENSSHFSRPQWNLSSQEPSSPVSFNIAGLHASRVLCCAHFHCTHRGAERCQSRQCLLPSHLLLLAHALCNREAPDTLYSRVRNAGNSAFIAYSLSPVREARVCAERRVFRKKINKVQALLFLIFVAKSASSRPVRTTNVSSSKMEPTKQDDVKHIAAILRVSQSV